MEKNIDDIEFRELVLSLKNHGFTISEIINLTESSERLIIDIIRTFSVLDVKIELNHGKYTKEELKLINSNFSLKEIAKRTKRSYFTIKDKRKWDRKTKRKQDMREENVTGHCKRYSKNEYSFIKISYENGITTSQIANTLNRSEQSIRSFCTRHNIKRKIS